MGGQLEQTPETKRRADALAHFEQKISQFVGLISQFFYGVERLEADALLTYLHGQISNKDHEIKVPKTPMYLDELLSDTPLSAGTELFLGLEQVRVISIKGYPTYTLPQMLAGLDRLGFSYRFVNRFLGFSYEESVKELRKYERQLFGQQERMVDLLTGKSGPGNRAAMAAADSVGGVLQGVEEDYICMGYHSMMVVLKDPDAQTLKAQVNAVHQVLNRAGFVTVEETAGVLGVWLSSLSGHVYPNPRRAILSSQNVAHLLPLSASWSGEPVSTHLGHAPHLYTVTQGTTPFRLNLNVGDVGHTMVLGPTGSGKSVFLGLLELQWLKYPGAQVIVFDKGRSARAVTEAVGGRFIELDLEQQAVCFQPLRRLEKASEFEFAQSFIEELLTYEKVELEFEQRHAITQALQVLKTSPVSSRTLSAFSLLLQEPKLRRVLEPYCDKGRYATLWDNADEQLAQGQFITFEMHKLMEAEPKVVALTLRYLFERLTERFDGSPTLLVLDEAWVFLDNPLFAPRIKQWLKELRKLQVYVIFASQELADALNSPLSATLLQSCQTRILLPNPQATQMSAQYEKLGLNAKQIEIISHARPKQDYYFTNPQGDRLFGLNLSPLELALVGASTPQDHQYIDAARAQAKRQGRSFASVYLELRGFGPEAKEVA